MHLASFMERKIWKIPVYALVIAAVIGVATGAVVYTVTLTGQVTIIEKTGDFSFEVYSDSACTTKLTSFDLGEASAGQYPVPLTFWIKNTGNATITRFNVAMDYSPVLDPANLQLPTNLGPGSVQKATINFRIKDNPPVGIHEFQVWIEAVA